MTSTEKLIKALEEARAPENLIENAKSGMYNDTQTQVAFPIVTLTQHLRDVGLHNIADRAVSGEFDATSEEWDEWIKSGELTRILLSE